MKKIILLILIMMRNLTFSIVDENFEEKENIKILQELRVTTIDPIDLSDIYSKRVFDYLYDTLFEIDNKGNIILKLVENYKYLDNKRLYIKLKDKIKFQDNSFLTAKDVKESLITVKEKGALKEFYKNIKEIDVKSKTELIIKLEKEDEDLLMVLAHNMSSIIKEKNNILLGTGKYLVESFNKDDITLIEKDNPKKKIIIDRVFSVKERMLALYNDNADIIYDINSYDIERGKKLGFIDEKNIDIKLSDNIVTSALVFNEKRDLKFREVIESLLYQEAQYILPTEIYGKNFIKLDNKINKKEIKKYIKSLDKNKRKISFMILNTEEDRKIAEKLKKDFEKEGLNVEIEPYQVDAFYYKLKEREFDMALQHIVFNKKYPQISLGKVLLYDIYDRKLYNQLDIYKEKIEKEKDKEVKKEIFEEAVNNISKELPYIPLKHQPLYILSKKNR